jgi:hypothetical protein
MTTVQANRGSSIPDTVAVGESNELQTEWLAKQRINTQDRIQLKKLSHMRYQHPDLDEIERFRIGIVSFFLRVRLLPYRHRLSNASCNQVRDWSLV